MLLRFTKIPSLRSSHSSSTLFARSFCTDGCSNDKYRDYIEKYENIPKHSLSEIYAKKCEEYLQSPKLEVSKAEEMRVELRVLYQLCNKSQNISDIKREEEIGSDYTMAPKFGRTATE